MSSSALDLSLPLICRCVRLINAPEVAQTFVKALPGWPVKLHAAQGKMPPLYIAQDAEGLWQGEADSDEEYYVPSPTSAVCSVLGPLIAQRLALQPELFGLHCASVEINKQLVIFPENSKAGKSTLAAAFAAAGYKVFGDDVLGLTTQGEGVAMGAAPRLRLPLPSSFSTEFVNYIQRHAGPQDDRYGFVLPADNGLASYTDACSVGAIVLLERYTYADDDKDPDPELIALPPSEGLLQLLSQNLSHHVSSEQLLERLLPLMQRIPCFLFRYTEPLAGARYLAKNIESLQRGSVQRASLLNYAPAETEFTSLIDLQSVCAPATTVSVYPLGEELFLIHTLSGAIHKLNSSGRAVWQLLQQEPLSGYELSELLAAHFEVPAPRVETDIAVLLTALAQADLIVLQ